MRIRAIVIAILATAAAAGLVLGPAATAKPERQASGTVVIGADQEPATLNFYTTEGNSYTTSLAVNPVLAPGAYYNQNAELVPYLFDGAPKLLKSDPLTVSFAYKASAKWSDGRPLTGQDFLATYRTFMNPNWDITSREGWEDIASIKVKGKNVTVAFKKGRAYSAWDALVANTSPMPAHKLRRPGLRRPLAERHRRLERAVQVRELAAGDADRPRPEQRVQRCAEGEGRPNRLPVHPVHAVALPGAGVG